MIDFRRSWPTCWTRTLNSNCPSRRCRKKSERFTRTVTPDRSSAYFQHLLTLQAELIKLQDWVQHTKAKIVVVFEGRHAAGKGGVIKRIMQRLNPRVCRVVALPAPTEREKTQWYFQRCTSRSAGRWRNRAVRSLLVITAPASSA